ncbi:hypothetical protein [Ideonella sp. BN130291]|uniref:hypothetical protein n=1 Tax=Ideonella sp. BN130291 TaxID=3112940 RepID=UPI002E26CF58|nr:hypothetical protein [Ideonella sp. BN130291]
MNTRAIAAAAAAAWALSFLPAASAAPDTSTWTAARAAAADLAAELSQACPVASTGDQAAFDACRQGLFGDSAVRRQLASVVLWGRQRDASLSLKETSLTQFAPDVLTGMYLPLFMFNGEHTVDYVEREGLFQIRLRVAFRNRLQPGQFPYPFWHEAEKWAMYQGANEVLFWWDGGKRQVKAAQFTVFGKQAPLVAAQPVPAPRFDGQWMWTDDRGRTQPKVTVFDGLFRADNPYLNQLDASYKTLALRLREGQCSECHVPNNPDKSKRLVLLQTPAHAAGEIQRLLRAVRDDRMPRDQAGVEAPLDKHTKEALLQDGEAFAKVVEAAKRWEATQARTRMASQVSGTGGQ